MSRLLSGHCRSKKSNFEKQIWYLNYAALKSASAGSIADQAMWLDVWQTLVVDLQLPPDLKPDRPYIPS